MGSLLTHAKHALSLYGAHTQLLRAFPWEADGLVPVQRRLLYAMAKLEMWPGTKYRKSAVVVGLTLGNYHPHGDAACYESLCQMSGLFPANEKLALRHTATPSVDFQGNLGGVQEPNAAAALRYTEVRLTKYAEQVFFHPDVFPHVPHTDNYDRSTTEPVYLANTLPNLLCNGNIGIAVGRASKWPAFDVNSVHELCFKFAENPHEDFDWYTHGMRLRPVSRYGGYCTSAIPKEFLTGEDFSLSWSCTIRWDGHNAIVTGMAPGVLVPPASGWKKAPAGTAGVIDTTDKDEGFSITIVPDAEVSTDPILFGKWQMAVEKALSATEKYQTRIVTNFEGRSIANFGLPDLLFSWHETLRDLLEKNRTVKLDELKARRAKLIAQVLAVEHADTIMESRRNDSARDWLLTQLPFEDYGMERSVASVKAVVATPLATLLDGEVAPIRANAQQISEQTTALAQKQGLVSELVSNLHI